MISYSFQAFAVTFEEYIVDHDGKSLHVYLTGYVDAIYDNAYLLGGCPRRLQYRPYGEFFQHIDVYIAQETGNQKKDLEKFYKKPIEPFLTAIVMKYIDCRNPESLKLEDEKKEVQIGIREIARNIMEQTKRYSSPFEREKDFQYEKYLDRLKNPKKYAVKCPACKSSKDIFTPVPLQEPQISTPTSVPTTLPMPENMKTQVVLKDQEPSQKQTSAKDAKITIVESKPETQNTETKAVEPDKTAKVDIIASTTTQVLQATDPQPVKAEEKPSDNQSAKADVVTSDNQGNNAGNTPEKPKTITETIEPLQLPSKEDIKNLSKKATDKIRDKTNDAKYQLENLQINFDNLDAITLPDS